MTAPTLARLLAALAVLTPPLAAPAPAQTLRQRIQAVRSAGDGGSVRPPSRRVRMLQALLYTDLTVDFDHTAARAVMEYVATALGINLIGRYADDPAGHGIDPETPITLSVKDLPAVEILELVLEQCSVAGPCTWQLRRGYVEVGTKERLAVSGAQVLHVYPIDELLLEPPRHDDAPLVGMYVGHSFDLDRNGRGSGRNWGTPGYGGYGGYGGGYRGGYGGGGSGAIGSGNAATGTAPTGGAANTPERKTERGHALVKLIVDSVEPDAWRRNGGDWAWIEYQSGGLVVRAPDFIHREIGGYPPVPPPDRTGEPSGEPAPEPPPVTPPPSR